MPLSPARKLKKSAVKNICLFPAIKSMDGRPILVESILEMKYCLHLEFDDQVKSYFGQPETFRLVIDSQEVSYTPDFKVNTVGGEVLYVEVKPSHTASTDRNKKRFKQFQAHCRAAGCKFLVVDESTIHSQPLLSNFEKLFRYRKHPVVDYTRLSEFAEIYPETVELRVVVDAVCSLGEVYTWLALGYLKFDIESESLSLASEVAFNVN